MASTFFLTGASPLAAAPPKQSRFRLRPRLISCSAAKSPNSSNPDPATPLPKVDRRNILFGLGGVGLMNPMDAGANPIEPPEFNKCGTATNLNTGKPLDINCCPPVTTKIIDFKLPPVGKIRVRNSAHRVSAEYTAKYNAAIKAMKSLPDDDPRSFKQQANVHCAYCNGAYDQPGGGKIDLQVHNSWLFFPFHRWYLYFFEKILGSLIKDPDFALPFWNWDNPKGMTIPPIFLDSNSAIYDVNRNQAHLPPAVIDLGLTGNTDPLQVVSNNLTIMYNEMLRGNSSVYDFMGKAYREGDGPNPGPGASERGSHTSVHVWVGDTRTPSGEDMGNFYSAGRDPLFYVHHTNVDRMWVLWQYFLPSNKVPDKRITDPDFLNAAFLFYDENAQLTRVTVKDCLDNLSLGYEYERIDLPWIDYRPPPQTAKAKISRIDTGAKTATSATLFPLKLESVVRVLVPKTKKGKADELLVLENITVDTTKFLKFDVFINDEDEKPTELDKAAYVGTYAQVPHKTNAGTATTSIQLKLTDVYDDMNVEEDEDLIVTLVPRHQGPGVTIGGIKIIANPNPTKAAATTSS
ncbi:polyphenoloxidase [Genlisea aurea]|uniref:Polyphenoloxidase n=1 Tax=Genlisea aurea TaxID=192259 RepID=S8BXW0_9LAMI|nr:polyphenoloxidase [Genlisea aurea]